MERPQFESNLDARVAFKQMTGLTIRLTPWELIEKITQKDDGSIVVTIQTHTVSERTRETVLLTRATKLIQFVQSDSGAWVEALAFRVEDADFERQSIPLFGPGKTPEQWLMARQWERMAYRVGSAANPLDNYTRVGAGYTPARMTRHWN